MDLQNGIQLRGRLALTALQLHSIFLEAGGSQHPGACGRVIGLLQLCFSAKESSERRVKLQSRSYPYVLCVRVL